MEEADILGQSESKEDKAKKKKDKKKEKEKEKKEKEKEKKEGGAKKKNKQAELIKELLKKRQEQEDEQKRQQEEEERRLEEQQRQKEEQERLAQEKKEEVKRRKAEQILKQKKEGTFLTKKQKQERAKAQRLFENQSIIAPTVSLQNEEAQKKVEDAAKEEVAEVQRADGDEVEDEHEEEEDAAEEEEEVVENWEKIADDTAKQQPEVESVPGTLEVSSAAAAHREKPVPVEKALIERGKEEESSSETSSEEDEEEEADSLSAATVAKETRDELFARVRAKIAKRKELANAKRSVDNLRSPVICVLGHVDTGKTKMLDTIRRSNVQEGEAGGITQQIGATRVPAQAIKERFLVRTMQLPGFLIIDTPGHESFANMRSRGSSLCDFAVLVVDVMHGLEPQTIESLKLLLKRRTPFVVALNKVDRLYGYESNPRKDIWQHLKAQPSNTQLEFKERFDRIVGEFSEQGINVALANKKMNADEYVSVVPTSAFLGDGIGNLMAHIVEQCQTQHAQRLAFCEELECIVMEVRSLPGLGTTIDVILINGTLRVNDIVVLTGSDGPIATPIRDLLMPQPLKEIRVKNDYEHYKEIGGAQGVKMLAKGLERAVAGLPLYVATTEEELEVYKEDAENQLKNALMAIKKKPEGVYVQTQKIPYSNVNIGPVHKKDVQKAAAMLEHNVEFACILAFDVPVDREVQLLADKEGVRVFQANIIYHLEDSFLNFRSELASKRRRENEHLAIFPCKLRIMPQNVFKSRDPIICGVSIEAGQLKKGTPLAAKTNDEVILLGTVSSIERNHEQNTTGDAPRLYGRHFSHEDVLISKITRESIDVCKNYFRDDLTKSDWALVIQLKKMLQIL
uniref:Eukaryotic translation initiation factor 5B n=1 Tax=Globodera rostochiensis TaxID=31243 RepID=A0A914I606_GLORO